MHPTPHTARPEPELPLISVVIPTYGRPDLLRQRALTSALRQTYPNVEVIVVPDGDDGVTRAALEPLDLRVRVVTLEQRSGVSAARNAGVRAARGEWIALLDDDDEWGADKLAEQLHAARRSIHAFPVVFSGYIGRTPAGDRLHPRRLRAEREPIGDYMLIRRHVRDEACAMLSSVFFVPRPLLLRVPFREDLRSQEDWDWLLRAEQEDGVGFEQVPLERPTALAVYYTGEDRPSGSRHLQWPGQLQWAQEHRRAGHLSERAFAGFLVSQLAPRASATGDQAGLALLGRTLLSSRPTPMETMSFLKHVLLPARLRRQIRMAINAVRPAVRLDA